MLELDIAMTLERHQVIDVKAGIRGGRVARSLASVCELDLVKAGIRGGCVIDSLDVLVGGHATAEDALVRHAAALQLIDVKAHVLGGLA